MDSRRQKNIPLSCRFIPYDQWFLTHVDPTWKIRHLKQLVLARCFDLPFDPRGLGGVSKDVDGARVPSPITFAPDQGLRPISPIKFANPQELRKKKSGVPSHASVKDDESSVGHQTPSEEATEEGTEEPGKEAGYEEDDEWDDAEDFDDDDDEEEEEEDTVFDLPSPVLSDAKLTPIGPGTSGRIGSFASTPSSSSSLRAQAQSQSEFTANPDMSKPKGRFNPLSKIGTKERRREQADAAQHSNIPEEEGIKTVWFTLIRFVTGQVLEDDFPIAWYDLAPHEIVEMHGSAPLVNFSVSSALSHLLYNGPHVNVVPSHITLTSNTNHQQNEQSLSAPLIKSGIISSADAASALASALLIPSSAMALSTAKAYPHASTSQSPTALYQALLRTQNQFLSNHPPRLACLPRMNPDLYVQPYWEGWVRILRTVTPAAPPRIADAPGPGGRGRFEYPEYSGGMTGGGGVGLVAWETAFGGVEGSSAGDRVRVRMDDGRVGNTGRKNEGGWDGYGHQSQTRDKLIRDKDKSYLEWRERWAVVKDGYIHLFKTRDDTKPAHSMALGALLSVRSAEQLASSIHKSGANTTFPTRLSHHNRPAEHRRSASQPRVSTSTVREGARSQPTMQQSHHRPRNAHDGEEAGRAQGTSSQTGSTDRKSEGSGRPRPVMSRPLTEEEIQAAREREMRREVERAKEAERRRIRERREKEIESLRKWDDISLSFPFGKGKDKDKGKARERDKEPAKRSGSETKSKDEDNKRAEIERERAREKEREKERVKEREREKERERDRFKPKDKEQDSRTYIPESRDEAEAAGMRIICARFQSTAAWERQERERLRNKAALAALEDPIPQPAPRHYTSTGPSLAGASTTQTIFEEPGHDNSGRDGGGGHGHNNTIPPRKASLPGIGIGTNKQGVAPSVSMASLATTGTASSIGRAESLAIGGSKFAISLFGKEADDGGRREKDDKKREDKEKKAREKEQKALEKEKKKAKRKEEEEEEFGMGTALSWKVNKKSSKPALGTSAVGGTVYDARPQVPAKDLQPVAGQANIGASVPPARPKLTISPSATPRNDAVTKSDSDSGSSLSISSPVFAHSTDSEKSDDDDDYGYGKARQGYRYGGYNPANTKSPQKVVLGASNAEADGNRSESGASYLATTKPPMASESSTSQQRNELPKPQSHIHDAPSHHHSQEKGKQRATVEEKGEWLVLDLGSEQAFNSLLRVFHRHSSTPSESDFLAPSIAAALSKHAASLNPDGVKSMPTSPTQRNFQPASTLGRERDPAAEQHSILGPSLSSRNARNISVRETVVALDCEGIHAPSTAGPSSLGASSSNSQGGAAQIPKLSLNTSLQNLTLPPPALPYPEWRTEVVHRARRYGMREAGRPLELVMYGWGRYFVDMDTSAVYTKMRKKEAAHRQKLRKSIALSSEISKSPRAVLSWEDVSSDDDDGVDGTEETGAEHDWERADSKRRMSTVSHVSTIKANRDAAKAEVMVQVMAEESDHEYASPDNVDVQTDSTTSESESDTIENFADGEYEGGYAYGLDDEEDALAEGLGSINGDSEEESEVEWFAWTTDLPRQVMERQKQAESEKLKEEKLRAEQDLYDGEAQSLSPMEFSSPFTGDNSSFISQNIALPTVLPPIPPPKTPEEERRQYAEKRRKLEPSAISTSLPPPVPTLPISPRLSPGGSRLSSQHTSNSTSGPQSSHQMRTASQNIAQGGYHAQRLTSYSSTLSSPSSAESIGYVRQGRIATTGATAINVGAANSARSHSNPISPLGGVFSPVDDEYGSPSSSTTPPSATITSRGTKGHQRGHSRSISGTPGDNEVASKSTTRSERLALHHSISMPFAANVNPTPIPAASSPHSPTRAAAEKTLAQPISMPILTAAQISQIESEMEEKLMLNAQRRDEERRVNSMLPSPSTSPPSSSYSHYSIRESDTSPHGPSPRRSSSAGLTPAGSPPSGSGVSGLISRSASVTSKPLPPQPGEASRERGLLRKKRSDLGRNPSGGDKEREQSPSPSSKQRPTLSLMGLSNSISNNFVDPQSPTQRQHPRGPRSAHPEIQEFNTSGVGASSGSTYQSAKALLRRVRSGSSLGKDMRIEEVSPNAESAQSSWPPVSPPSTVITSTIEAGDSASSSRKKKGAMDRIVRGLDSAFEFVDGR